MKEKKEHKLSFGKLKEYEKNGCEVRLDGRSASSKKIMADLLKEPDAEYMWDFISDDERRVRVVDLIRIKKDPDQK